VAAVVVGVKAWVIPRVLSRIGAGAPVRPIAPGRSSGMSVLVAGALVVVAYVIMLPVTAAAELPTEGAIPLAFAIALIGLFLCVTGRDALGHILGFLVFENGIFGLAILATYGLPGIVEAGVFLDVLVIVLIMEALVVAGRRALRLDDRAHRRRRGARRHRGAGVPPPRRAGPLLSTLPPLRLHDAAGRLHRRRRTHVGRDRGHHARLGLSRELRAHPVLARG